ncbi:MAG: MFS transporter, partial [Thermoleophilaceae bacterium]
GARGGARGSAGIDWAGAALLSAALVCILTAVSKGNDWGWGSPRVLGPLAAGGAIVAIWGWVEAHVDAPMVDMRMMRRRGVWTSNVAALLIGFGMFGAFIITPQLVQTPAAAGYGFGASVTEAGLFMLPSSAVMLLAAPLSGWLGTRVGSRVPVLLGTAAGAVSFSWLALAHDEPWQVLLGLALLGVAIGLSLAALANLVVEAVEQTRTGVATGMNTIMRMIGGSLGAQIAASVVGAHVVAGSALPAESGYTGAFAILALALVLAFVVALAGPRMRAMA